MVTKRCWCGFCASTWRCHLVTVRVHQPWCFPMLLVMCCRTWPPALTHFSTAFAQHLPRKPNESTFPRPCVAWDSHAARRCCADTAAACRSVFNYIQTAVSACVGGAPCFPSGSWPGRTYLPDSDLDVTVLLPPGSPVGADWFIAVNQALVLASASGMVAVVDGAASTGSGSGSGSGSALVHPDGGSSSLAHPSLGQHTVRSVTFVNAAVQIVSAVVDNVKVDVTANRGTALMANAMLEHVDAAVGRDHLFKRSVLLVKAWCSYESSELGGGLGVLDSLGGTLCTYALEVLMMCVFNAYASVIHHPMHALALFFYMYAEFPWGTYTITVDGPVHSFTGQQDFTWNESQPRFFHADLVAQCVHGFSFLPHCCYSQNAPCLL